MDNRPTVVVDSAMTDACRLVIESAQPLLGPGVRCWIVVPKNWSASNPLLVLHERVPAWREGYLMLVLYDRGKCAGAVQSGAGVSKSQYAALCTALWLAADRNADEVGGQP